MQTQLRQHAIQLNHTIRYHCPGTIEVNGVTYTHPIYLNEHSSVLTWQIETIQMLSIQHLEALKTEPNTLILIGTGSKHVSLPITLLAQSKCPIESMRTQAACQTYLVLAQDKRPVTLALIP